MIHFISFCFLASLAASTALFRRLDPPRCCFSLIAQGAPNKTINEDQIGKNGFGGVFPQTQYCVSNNTLTDFTGRTCSILPSNGQFLCDKADILASTCFTLAENSKLLHDGRTYYYICPVSGPGNEGSYSIFSDEIVDSTGCITITILVGNFNCSALGRPTTASTKILNNPAPSTIAATPVSNAKPVSNFTCSTASSISTSRPSCPADIRNVTYLPPTYIIPVSPSSPDTALNPQQSVTIGPQNTTTFTFDVPSTFTNYCGLVFQLPFSNKVQFPYIFSGLEQEEVEEGGFDFALLDGEVGTATTFNTLPGILEEYGKVQILPGNNYLVAAGPCRIGQRVSYVMKSVNETFLQYFQNAAASPIGCFVVPCF